MAYALGIDVGGTKCDALLARADGTVLQRGRGSVSDGEKGRGAGRSDPAITAALREALHGIDLSSGLCVAHNGSAYMEPILERELPKSTKVRLCTEADMALALAGADTGIVVCSGTGSFVHGRRADGRRVHLDGVGPLLGDYGSAYQVGLHAFRAAFRSGWHERHATSLAGAVYRFCSGGTDEPNDDFRLNSTERHKLSEYQRGAGRFEIAALAPLVDAEVSRGDSRARKILDDAARDLGETLFDVIDRLDLAAADAPLLGTGGNLVKSDIVWNDLCIIASRLAPNLKPRRITDPLVLGGVLCLLAPVGSNHGSAGIRANLFRTTREFMDELFDRRLTDPLEFFDLEEKTTKGRGKAVPG